MGFEHLKAGQVSAGGWGEHTSTIDWCEINYDFSPHIAEFFNTISNGPFIALGLYGYWQVQQAGLPLRIRLPMAGLVFIGVGSLLFHMSLKWPFQMWDELGMIYVISFCTFLVFDTLPGWKRRWGWWGIGTMCAYDAFVTFSYGYLGDPVMHQIAFGCTMAVSLIRTSYLISCLPPSHIHPAKGIIFRMVGTGVATFIVGFVLWNLDNLFCDTLRAWREKLGNGLIAGVFEFHAWWHLLTGMGSYLILLGSGYLCAVIKTDPDAYYIHYGLFNLPSLHRSPIANGDGPVDTKAVSINSPLVGKGKSLRSEVLLGKADGLRLTGMEKPGL